MAYGGVPNHTGMEEEATASAHEATGTSLARDLVEQLGQVSLEPSTSSSSSASALLPAATKAPAYSPDKYSLRNLEIQQTLGQMCVLLGLYKGMIYLVCTTNKSILEGGYCCVNAVLCWSCCNH